MREEESDIICPLTSNIVTFQSTETGGVKAERVACAVWLRTRNTAFPPSSLPHAGSDGWVMGLYWQVALIFITTHEEWSQWTPMAKWLGGDVTLISLKTSARNRSQSVYIDPEDKCWSKISFLRLKFISLSWGEKRDAGPTSDVWALEVCRITREKNNTFIMT